MPTMQLNNDVALGVAIPSRNARGRIARLGSVVNSILAAHEYPPLLENLLAEALTLTALRGYEDEYERLVPVIASRPGIQQCPEGPVAAILRQVGASEPRDLAVGSDVADIR